MPRTLLGFILAYTGLHQGGLALLSVSVLNVIRSSHLRDTDMRQPASVLRALNEAFQMERNNSLYFSMWYGVYDRRARTLSYASGGHPPALLLGAGGATTSPVVR